MLTLKTSLSLVQELGLWDHVSPLPAGSQSVSAHRDAGGETQRPEGRAPALACVLPIPAVSVAVVPAALRAFCSPPAPRVNLAAPCQDANTTRAASPHGGLRLPSAGSFLQALMFL